MDIRINSSDNAVEEQLLTSLVVSNDFCKTILTLYSPDYIQNKYIKKVIGWIQVHYKLYGQAPMKDIKVIFIEKQRNMAKDEIEIIDNLLYAVLNKPQEKEKFNVEYYVEKTLDYFRARASKIMADGVSEAVARGDADSAEKIIAGYRRIAKSTSAWVNPFDHKYIRDVLRVDDEGHDSDFLFRFPGKIGELIGDQKRDMLVGILGPMKRGKSWWLQEYAIQGMISGCKVAFFSFEMKHTRVSRRFYKRTTALGDKAKEYVYPCFDCFRNQVDNCKNPSRANRIKLLDEEGNQPPYRNDMPYRPCCVCRGKDSREYVPATWFFSEEREELSTAVASRRLAGISRTYGDNIRLRSFPPYTVNLDGVMRELDFLEYSEGFVPDIIITDYADVIAPEDKGIGDYRHRLDDTWKKHKRLAAERKCLVVTASQSNRIGKQKKTLDAVDIAEDIRKIAHVDMMFALNQTPTEKAIGVMRVGIIALRDDDYNINKQCIVLQQLSLGQTLIDSEFAYVKKINAMEDFSSILE